MKIQKYGPSGRKGSTITAANVTQYIVWNKSSKAYEGVLEIKAAMTGDKYKIVGNWEEFINFMTYKGKKAEAEIRRRCEAYDYHKLLIAKIQDALGTAETGLALIEVAANAHRAEQELAAIEAREDSRRDDG